MRQDKTANPLEKRKHSVIGNAILINADCLDVVESFPCVDHIITDPPYERETHDSIAAKNIKRNDGGNVPEPLKFASIDPIRKQVAMMMAGHADKWAICFATVEGLGLWKFETEQSGLKYKRACAWIKPDCSPQFNGQGPAQGFETFFCAWAGQGAAKWNAGGKRGVYVHNVNGKTRHGVHPTEKPLSLMRSIIEDFTEEGETIFDPFMGSGSTGVAALQMNRKFIGVEVDKTYYEIACARITDAIEQPDIFYHSKKSETLENRDIFDEETG